MITRLTHSNHYNRPIKQKTSVNVYDLCVNGCLIWCWQWLGAEAMQLVLGRIKQGLEAVGKEVPSQTSDAHGTDEAGSNACPRASNSEVACVIQSYLLFVFYALLEVLKQTVNS